MNYGRNFAPPMMHINNRNSRYIMPYEMTIFGGILERLKSFNWKGLLNGTSKTLNFINQTIPLVRNAKPMFNNMKNMVNLVKAFGKEVNTNNQKNINSTKKEVSNNNYPNFFL